MIRIFTLCALSAFGIHGLAAAQSVDVRIALVAVYSAPTCTIAAGTAAVDFGTVTSPRSSTIRVDATGSSVTITGTGVKNVDVSIENTGISGHMENSDGDRISYTTALSRDNCGCANRGGSLRTITCTCDVSGRAVIPAQVPAGSYSGTSTLSATCSQ